ncbi:hypothetical protein, partial [Actinomadura sp. 7K534]|uniref:hypothetical protein n=1 Tax=Actinomadura sp. 7K534 TaxID=2530366 RepID=UPI001A9D19E1
REGFGDYGAEVREAAEAFAVEGVAKRRVIVAGGAGSLGQVGNMPIHRFLRIPVLRWSLPLAADRACFT